MTKKLVLLLVFVPLFLFLLHLASSPVSAQSCGSKTVSLSDSRCKNNTETGKKYCDSGNRLETITCYPRLDGCKGDTDIVKCFVSNDGNSCSESLEKRTFFCSGGSPPPGTTPPLGTTPVPTVGPGWGACGSCDCGHPGECVTTPEGGCTWDPGRCAAPPGNGNGCVKTCDSCSKSGSSDGCGGTCTAGHKRGKPGPPTCDNREKPIYPACNARVTVNKDETARISWDGGGKANYWDIELYPRDTSCSDPSAFCCNVDKTNGCRVPGGGEDPYLDFIPRAGKYQWRAQGTNTSCGTETGAWSQWFYFDIWGNVRGQLFVNQTGVETGEGFCSVPFDPDAYSSAPILAVDATASYEGRGDSKRPALNAIDGLTDTHWWSGTAPQWINVELGGNFYVTSVDLNIYHDRLNGPFTETVEIYTGQSQPAPNITKLEGDLTSVTNQAKRDEWYTVKLDQATLTRHVRVNVTSLRSTTDHMIGFNEVRVNGFSLFTEASGAKLDIQSAKVSVLRGGKVSDAYDSKLSTFAYYRGDRNIEGLAVPPGERSDGEPIPSIHALGWIEVDLGASYELSGIKLYKNNSISYDNPNTYTEHIYISDNPISKAKSLLGQKQFNAVTGGTNGPWLEVPLTGSARFLKIETAKNESGEKAKPGFSEIKVNGEFVYPYDYSTSNRVSIAYKMFDGAEFTYWDSRQDNAWIWIDLGSGKALSSISLKWADDIPSSYKRDINIKVYSLTPEYLSRDTRILEPQAGIISFPNNTRGRYIRVETDTNDYGDGGLKGDVYLREIEVIGFRPGEGSTGSVGVNSAVLLSDPEGFTNRSEVSNLTGTFAVPGPYKRPGDYRSVLEIENPEAWICQCPIGCTYYGQDAPDNQNDFYILDAARVPKRPWMQVVDSEVRAARDITSTIPDTCTQPSCLPFFGLKGPGGYPGVISYGVSAYFGKGGVSQDTGWLAKDLTSSTPNFYELFLARMGPPDTPFPEPLFFTTKPAVDPTTPYTAYVATGDVTTEGPWQIQSTEKLVIFVDGNLTIKDTITIVPGGFLAFIVKGNITIDRSVGTTDLSSTTPLVEGVYVTSPTGTIRTDFGSTKFVGKGTFVSGSINPQRNLGETNNASYSADLFLYNPSLLFSMPDPLMDMKITWEEVAP